MSAATEDNSYDIMVPPLIGNTASTTYFDLTTGITLPVARTFSTDSNDSDPAPETGDDQHVEELQLQCTHCRDMFLPEGCFCHVGAIEKTGVQHFCETSEKCQL